MSKFSGGAVFTTPEGVQRLLDKYLTTGDREELRGMNNHYTQEKFERGLIDRLERRAGGGHWIPSNYKDELVDNAAAIIGSNKERRKTKKGDEVDVYKTRGGKEIYEDKRGRLRNYGSGKYARKNSFDD